MINLAIDGEAVSVEEGTYIFQAARVNNIEILLNGELVNE